MKKIIFTLFICYFLVSCGKDNLYSCDPQVEQWAITNAPTIQKMTRSQFETLDGNRQQAAYRVFDGAKRISLWKAKLKELSEMNFSDDEKTHITKLIRILDSKTYWFDDPRGRSKAQNNTVNDEIVLFAYEWVDYAKENFKWDDAYIYKLVGTPLPVVYSKDKSISKIEVLTLTKSDNENLGESESARQRLICNCLTGWSACEPFQCKEGYMNCYVENNWGCGFLWLYACNGRCYYN